MPVVSLREAIVGEHDGFVDLVFTLDVAAAATTSFTWNTSPGTATAGSDFLTASGSVVFAAGQTQQMVRLTLVDDGLAEGFESFLVTLGGASGLTLAQNQFLITLADDDTVVPVPRMSMRGGTFDERDGKATFTVVLGAASASAVSVDYVTAEGTARAGTDFVATSGTLVFLPGETVKTVSVVLTDDAVAESLERFGLVLSSPVGATLGDASASAVIGASDAPLAGPPRISVADAVAGESDGWVDLVLTLSGPSASVVSATVTANASNGTVTAGDFQSRGATIVNFEPGETTRVLRLQLTDDTLAEPAEFIAVSLSNVLNATVAQPRALVAIVDDDAVGAAPAGLSVRDVAVDERAGTATFTVLLGGTAGQAASGAVSVNYATEVATAGAADFVPATGTLVFAPGETVKSVTVDLIDDALAEGIEAFQLVLSGATGALIHDGRGTAIIGASDGGARTTPRIVADDAVVGESDGWVDLAVRLDAPSASPVSVNVTTSGGSATAGAAADYLLVSTSLTFLPGETLKTVRIAVMDDALAEGDEAIAVVLSGAVGGAVGEAATVVIVDDDSVAAAPLVSVRGLVVDESAGVARFVVTLGGEAAAGLVSVDYATEAGSALPGSDFIAQAGRLTFAPGETVKTVEVALVDDAVAEGAERFALVLSGATGATLGDARAEALISAGDGTAVATPRVSVHDAVVGEGDGWVDLRVTLDAPGTSFVSVNFNTFNGTAGSGSVGDFTAATGTLSFAPGETVKTVRVALSDDGAAETAESFLLALSSPTQATIARAEARVVVVDNDTVVASPLLSVRDAVVDESAGTVSFAVLLGGASGQASASPVSVAWATGGGTAAAGSDYAGASGALVFAPGETVKTVTVALVDDALAEADEWFGLTLSAPAGATLAQAVARAVIGANDAAAVATPRLSVADVVAGESDGWADLVVTLSAPSTNLVSVSYQTANGAASFLNSVANDDYVGDSGALVFAPGETTKAVRVQLHDQAAAEGAEHFLFTLFSPVNATLAKGDGYVHIVDDDTVVAQPTLVLRDVVVDEKAGSATFVVMLGGAQGQASDATVTVDWATTGGSAVAGSDFLAASGTLTFAPGETVKTVRIDLVDDFAAEGPERFFLDLSSPAGAALRDTRAEAVIGRSDGPPASTPLVSIADAIVGEHDGWVDLVVSLSATSLNPVTVQFATSAGSAGSASPADYAFDQGPIVFAPGETVKTVRIALNDDLLDEGLESFSVLLSGASGATLGDSRALVSIVDDEAVESSPGLSVRDVTVDEKAGTATFFVLLGGPAGAAASGPVTVDFTTVGGTAASGSDFRPASGTLAFAPGETVKAVTVEIVDDAATEGSESFRLELSNPSGAVIADGRADATIGGSDAAVVTTPSLFALATTASEGDGWVDVTLRLSAPSASNVVANYSTTAGTASYSSNADYVVRIGSVAFAPGETTKTVRVQLTDDATIEPLEQFQFQITSASGANFSTAPVGVTIVDDDDLPPEVPPEIFVRDVVVDEKAGTAVFTVTLGRDGTSTSTEPVQVRWATGSAGTAVAGQDFVASQGDLVFAPGQGTQTVLVNLIDDAVAEPAERFELTLSQPVGGQIVDGRGVAVIGLSDGTLAALPFVSIDPALAIEGEGWVDVVVRLGRPSSSAVQVDWATSAGSAGAGDFVAGAGTLVFAPGETTRTVRVDLVADATLESDETFTVVLSAAVGGSIAVGTATVTVVDDDGAAPVLRLGLGDDTYAVDRSDARVVEAPDEGRDRVISSAASFTLPEHVEELQLSGAATAGTGNAQDNLLVGNEGGDSLTGAAGRDTLDGGDGADTMSGGLDSDVFRVDDIGDVVVELADGGIDTVRALIGYTLGEHVEGLVLEGGKAFSGTGNGLGNSILGNWLPNLLIGLAGADSIDGGGGDDRIDGGDGDDTLLGGDGADTLLGGLGVDLLDGGAGAGSLDGGPGNDTYVVRDALTVTAEATGSGVDLVKAYVNHTLGAGIENLVLMEGGALVGVGNALPNRIDGNRDANVLVGAAGADTLNGYYGADTMQGGPGSDRYVFSGLADVVIELAGQGIDTIVLGDDFSLTQDDLAGAREVLLPANVENLVLGGLADRRGRGNELDNHITDGAGDNILFGMAGNDTLLSTAGADVLVGGVGDDVYLIGRNTARVDEYAGGGVDTVHVGYTWVLGDHVEHLVLTGTLGGVHGTGNASANSLTGNSAANRLTGLEGDDTLDGAAGADTLMGGLGNDLYVIDSSGDVVTEGVAEGIDTVRSSVTHVLGDNFEHLVLTGKLAINGTGNAKFNQITGNAGANVLDGQAGSDTMSGGAGNDTYWVDSIGDVVRELAGGGTDLVRSAVNFIMPANVENLRLTGTARIATGNTLPNVIVGNASANVIKGGAGSDTLTGGGGADLFVLDSLAGADTIRDFSVVDDTLRISQAGIRIGDGDTVVDGAQVRLARGGFKASAELVLFTPNAADLTTSGAAAVIGSATSVLPAGVSRIFVVDNGSQTGVFRFVSSANDALVSPGELTLLALLEGTATTALADYVFVT